MPPCRGAGSSESPSSCSVTSAPSRAQLRGEGGEPVGLVTADVGDAAQARRRLGERAQRGDRRRELADVVEVGVDARRSSRCRRRSGRRRRGRPLRPSGRGGRAARRRPGWSGAATRARGPGRRWSAPASGTARRWTGPARSSRRRLGRVRAAPSRCSRRTSTSTPCSRRHATVISMWGSEGTGGPSWRTLDALVVRRAGEQQRGDELARRGGVDDHLSAARRGRCPTTVNGSVPRPPSSTSTPSARRASRTPAIGRVRACGSPSNATLPLREGRHRRDEAHHRAGQAAVDRRRRAASPGVTDQSGPEVSTARAQRRQSRGHQLGVARPQRAAYDGGAVGQRRQHQRAVGQRLRARAARPARRPGRAPPAPATGRAFLRARLHAPEAMVGRATSRRAWPRAWSAWPGAGPRGGRRWRRASPARPRPAVPRCRPRRAADRRAWRGS